MGDESLHARIRAIVDAGRKAWPALEVAEEALAFHLARVREDPADVIAGDVYLACACACGVPGALEAFERTYLPEMQSALARLRARDDISVEVLQRVRIKLFVADAPKIASYSGRGPLGAWLRVLVVHEFVSLQRQVGRRLEDEADALLGEVAASDDHERAMVRAHFGPQFKEAFQEALDKLDARERNVLRLHLLDGLSVEQIGVAYGVHRVSVSRWLSAAREALFRATRDALCARLKMTPTELESIIRVCMSHLDVSLDRVLSPG